MARRAVRFTDLMALARHKASGARLSTRHLVLSTVLDKGNRTRREIAEITNLAVGTVSARVNELIKDGVLIEAEDHRACSVTGTLVHYVLINPEYKGREY